MIKDPTSIPVHPGGDTGSSSVRQAKFISMLVAHKGMIRKIACDFFTDEGDRQELVQEIVYRLWAGYERFREESKEGTWLYVVATHTAQMKHRSLHRHRKVMEHIAAKEHP